MKEKTREGELYKKLENNRVECYACAHRCKIREGKSGICKIRYNQNGKLMVPHGYVSAFQMDPIEKKPFFHAYPNSLALSFGMLGCNMHCDFCQNWRISQTIRDPNAGAEPRDYSVKDFIDYAKKYNARSIISTYNEPLITSEWSKSIFTEAKKHNLATGYVSNGYANEDVLDYLSPVLDLYKIDLKSFQPQNYKRLGASLDKVLESIEKVYQKGIWLEIVTLLIPGFNNSFDEIKDMTNFLLDLSPNIPWHITAYHQDYKLTDMRNTNHKDLTDAAEIARKMGMNFVYAGNRPGRVGKWEHTRCPNCDSAVIKRRGYTIQEYLLSDDGNCQKCGFDIPGRWEKPTNRDQMFRFF